MSSDQKTTNEKEIEETMLTQRLKELEYVKRSEDNERERNRRNLFDPETQGAGTCQRGIKKILECRKLWMVDVAKIRENQVDSETQGAGTCQTMKRTSEEEIHEDLNADVNTKGTERALLVFLKTEKI